MADEGVEILSRDIAEGSLRLDDGDRVGLLRAGLPQADLQVLAGGRQDLGLEPFDRGERDLVCRFGPLDLEDDLSLQVGELDFRLDDGMAGPGDVPLVAVVDRQGDRQPDRPGGRGAARRA